MLHRYVLIILAMKFEAPTCFSLPTVKLEDNKLLTDNEKGHSQHSHVLLGSAGAREGI